MFPSRLSDERNTFPSFYFIFSCSPKGAVTSSSLPFVGALFCFIGLNVDFTGVVSTVGGGGVLREKKKTLVAVAGDDISLDMIC